MTETHRRPHLLHLTIDDWGWLTWSLDCPYSATEVEDVPGRPCNLLEPNPEPCPDPETDPDGFDDWRSWVPAPGCFVVQWFDATGEWAEMVRLDTTDPQFPVLVDVEIEGHDDDAYVTRLIPWAVDQGTDT